MKAYSILDGIELKGYDSGINFEAEIDGISYDSREICENSIFFAYQGADFDSHTVAAEVYATGKVPFIVAEKELKNIPTVLVEDGRKALALACRNWFHKPDEKLEKVGITGTNGKTTVSYLLESIFSRAGKKPIRMGTTGCRFCGTTLDSINTTPSSFEYYQVLAEAVAEGCDSLAVEVSSHSLHQNRLFGTVFDVGLFTNLSGDHLDYHNTMEEYYEAKKRLFTSEYSNVCVVNIDDEFGARLAGETELDKITYGLYNRSEITAEKVDLSLDGIGAVIKYPGGEFSFKTTLVGLHNLENILSAVAASLALGIGDQYIKAGLEELGNVPGRLEKFEVKGAFVFVDYAHTDDALSNVLEALTPFRKNRVITIFGCGGDRDRTKRARMAKAAEEFSDEVVVTNDNPRTENPQQVIEDILEGFEDAERVIICPERREAIRSTLDRAEEGDIILIAGKGHEDYMVIGKERIHFDDREEVRKYLEGSE
ncbi:UDP-N-acetylmuramoyl-L-alanyl-D-glutamate--2,6-diaminopimelate ligase [Limisalsivibrio acetivorans]|uniref:UDP-N-acetylmuramoyl-L-alanyl-D-glutamate--2, 6-diaminopimelate ligase n=1 Tax=Limisalsivibrio acetivorans TaxID=1304888 RepID=UPI0003B489A3|nr:UDP-N-acetylmuramoyl-L-alanyl-D-glutamate--2,6-diaminopimelate ligase [Limisalsivibrio acetivorans]